MKRIFITLAFAQLLTIACNKSNPIEANYSNYMPLAVGNYWVYEREHLDSNGNKIGISFFNSLFIPGFKKIDARKANEMTRFKDSLKKKQSYIQLQMGA